MARFDFKEKDMLSSIIDVSGDLISYVVMIVNQIGKLLGL